MTKKERTSVLITEDDLVVAKNLVVTLEERGYEITGTVESGEELLDMVSQNPPDLIIMDINLAGRMDGIEATSKLDDIPVLYLTADRDPATLNRAKLTNPDGYLIKPFDSDELVSAIELALYRRQSPDARKKQAPVIKSDHLFVKVKNRLEKVQFDDIRYIEANDIYSTLVTQDQKLVLSYSLKTLEDKIPRDSLMRVHRSFIVNLKHIKSIEDNYLLIGQKDIPIGKTYREELMSKLSII